MEISSAHNFGACTNVTCYIFICVYWFELFSQVSDVAHGPLVFKIWIISEYWKKNQYYTFELNPWRINFFKVILNNTKFKNRYWFWQLRIRTIHFISNFFKFKKTISMEVRLLFFFYMETLGAYITHLLRRFEQCHNNKHYEHHENFE